MDKHRHLHVVNATAELYEVPTVNPEPANQCFEPCPSPPAAARQRRFAATWILTVSIQPVATTQS